MRLRLIISEKEYQKAVKCINRLANIRNKLKINWLFANRIDILGLMIQEYEQFRTIADPLSEAVKNHH